MRAQRIARRRGYDGARPCAASPRSCCSARCCACFRAPRARRTRPRSWWPRSTARSTERWPPTSSARSRRPSARARRSCCSSTAPGPWTRTPSRSPNGSTTRASRSSSGSVRRRPRPRGPVSSSCTRRASGRLPRVPASGRSNLSTCPETSPRSRSRRWRRSRRGGSIERGRETPLAFPDRPVPARAALDGHIASVAAVSITDLLAQVDGRTVGTADGQVTLQTKIATSDGRAAGHGALHRPRAVRPGAPRRRVADLDLRPARPGARGARVRGDAAGVRVRGVRRGRDARARRVRAHGRAVLPARARPAARRDRPADPRRASAEARTPHGSPGCSRSSRARC